MIINDFICKYKEKLFLNVEAGFCTELDEKATVAKFVDMFDFAFESGKIEKIKKKFFDTNKNLIGDIKESYDFFISFYDIEDKLKSLMKFSNFSKNNIEDTIEDLREYYNELDKRFDTEFDNSLNSEEKSRNINKMQDMSDDEIIDMFRGLTQVQ